MRHSWLVLGVMLAFTAPAWSAPDFDVPLPGGFLDVQYYAGEGENTSYLVIDFAMTGGGSYGFGYRWSGSATSEQMLNALVGAGLLDVTLSGPHDGYGYAIENFSYGAEIGNTSEYWRYELGSYDGSTVVWETAEIGISTRQLSHQSFDGWYNSWNTDIVSKPAVPTVVPEPTALSLIGIGALCLLSRRRRVAASH